MSEDKKGMSKGLKIGLLIVGLIAVVQIAVLFFILTGERASGSENSDSDSYETEQFSTYELESIQVNLAPISESSSRHHYLRTTIHLAYVDDQAVEVIADHLVQIQASLIDLLRLQTIDDLDTVDKTQKLSEEIQKTINELLGSDLITDVYFVEFIWQ